MTRVLRSKTLTVSIECPPGHVYGFVSSPENLPTWATAFCRSVRKSEGQWTRARDRPNDRGGRGDGADPPPGRSGRRSNLPRSPGASREVRADEVAGLATRLPAAIPLARPQLEGACQGGQ